MSFNRRTGENVSMTAGSLNSLANNFVFELHDANMNVRTLQPYERLIVDSLEVMVDGGGLGGPINVNVYFGPDAGGSDPPISSIILSAAFDPTDVNGNIGGTATYSGNNGEGISLPINTQLFVSGAGGNVNVVATGTGRIVNGKTAGVRPPYRERLNA